MIFYVSKIRSSCHLENLQKLLFFEALGNPFELVSVFKRKNNLIHNRFTFALFLLKSRQNDIDHLQNIVADFRVLIVPQGQILNHLRAAIPKIKLRLQETDRIELGNIEIILFPFHRKTAYNYAKIKESPLFHNKPCACGIPAINIKHGIPIEPRFPKQFVVNIYYLFDRTFQLLGKKSIEQEQKQFRASLVSKCFFESGIQSERSKPRQFFGHSNPRGKNVCDIIKPLPCRANVERRNIENLKHIYPAIGQISLTDIW